jgi:hypothetical protein
MSDLDDVPIEMQLALLKIAGSATIQTLTEATDD